MAHLRIGSRGSKLALWQANHVATLLGEQGHAVDIEIIKTTGDKITEVELAKVGTKGMFTKEIEEALADHRVDLAVHSLKDLPTELAPEYALAAILQREDPRDAFLCVNYATLAELPHGARLGTSSLRRKSQLQLLRPDLDIVSVRGNVDTRVRKLEAGEVDAMILAAAGLIRLGLDRHIRYRMPVEVICPAAGQGALAVEVRSDDPETGKLLAFLDHPPTRLAVQCERALLEGLGGGCQVPIGAFAETDAGLLWLSAVVGRPNGSEVLRERLSGHDPDVLVAQVLERLKQRGAEKILEDVYSREVAPPVES
ncbi:MAG TPA: hydroxymethylbilane synthase [Terriglobales bacterium]